MRPLRVALIGCGRISGAYLDTLARFPGQVEIVAVSGLSLDEARAVAGPRGLRAQMPEDVLADPSVEAVLNLTVPAAHAEVARAALEAGKHVYGEKPLTPDLATAAPLVALAEARGLLLGCAPDTFLGGRWQTVRRLVERGAIGRPLSVYASALTHGTERHNPSPDFYYAEGGGPLLDLGPYYLTALVDLLGPLARVAGVANRGFEAREIECGPRSGEAVPVAVDTHSCALLEFACGAVGTMTTSFDVWDSQQPRLEIHGTEGSICLPDLDPTDGVNLFGGAVWLKTRATARWTHRPRPQGREAWEAVPIRHGHVGEARGLGLVDLALAAREGRAPRASGRLALHVLEAMEGIARSGASGAFAEMTTTARPSDPLPEAFP